MIDLEQQKLEEKLRQIRIERYKMQDVAKKALPTERVSICYRQLLDKLYGVEVWQHQTSRKAFYGKLAVCASVWNCPVCAAKISERRRQELKAIYDKHLATGGKVALLTVTFSHKRNDRLVDLIEKMTKATKQFFSGKKYDKIAKKMGILGTVKAFEITYSEVNGFHPHAHYIIFYTSAVSIKNMQSEMRDRWQNVTSKAGLEILRNIGLQLQDGEKAEEYMTKHGNWGIDRELTKTHMKKGKNHASLTPFDFLRMYLDDQDEKYLFLFREYANAVKGKRQLYYSKGLKQMYEVDDKTDEQLATEKIEKAELKAIIDYFDWKEKIAKDKRAMLLDLVEKYGVQDAFNIVGIKKIQPNEVVSEMFNTIG